MSPFSSQQRLMGVSHTRSWVQFWSTVSKSSYSRRGSEQIIEMNSSRSVQPGGGQLQVWKELKLDMACTWASWVSCDLNWPCYWRKEKGAASVLKASLRWSIRITDRVGLMLSADRLSYQKLVDTDTEYSVFGKSWCDFSRRNSCPAHII